MINNENKLKPPKKNLEDASYEVTKFLGSRIPVIGKTIGDLFDFVSSSHKCNKLVVERGKLL
jgi:hypothetical protein